MKMRIYYLTGLIAFLCAGAAALFDLKIALGILLASGFSLLNMFMLSMSMKAVISANRTDASFMVVTSILRMTLLAVLLFIVFKHPQWFSIIGVTIGLLLFMIALIYDAAMRKKGE